MIVSIIFDMNFPPQDNTLIYLINTIIISFKQTYNNEYFPTSKEKESIDNLKEVIKVAKFQYITVVNKAFK